MGYFWIRHVGPGPTNFVLSITTGKVDFLVLPTKTNKMYFYLIFLNLRRKEEYVPWPREQTCRALRRLKNQSRKHCEFRFAPSLPFKRAQTKLFLFYYLRSVLYIVSTDFFLSSVFSPLSPYICAKLEDIRNNFNIFANVEAPLQT